ncbi:MAG TPA: FKBP-type peptidyl-prolyl cis-trans isomerase [Candidatus Paceibacterota bacterium]|nr:FKBP-type peptidyl-prolyl cis-trans isomerase [Candidatus Paceibacterota bacterium]
MTKRTLIAGIAVVVALAVVLLFFVIGNPFQMANDLASSGTTGQSNDATGLGQVTQLVVQDETVGTGAEAKLGDTVSVNYTGKLEDGTVFDTSVGKAPISFVLGAGTVIPGWEQGLQGMKQGGRRLLIIPPALGYGASGYGPIPPNATLVFEVELVKVTPAAQ